VTDFGVTDLSVEIDGHEALSKISLDVPAGMVTAVVGGDGAGKSTLLRCLVALVKPSSGSVHRPPKSQIGYMPASSGTWRELSVAENVEFVGRAYDLRGAELARRSRELLDRAGLSGSTGRLAGQLSGGMRQKLGFCLAMLHEPPLLVLDEPSTGVDAVSRVDLWRLIAQAAAHGAAVLMATTYLDEAERAGSVLVLDAGTQLLAGEPAEVLAAMEGSIVEVARPTNPAMAWRRGAEFHEWRPDDGPPIGRKLAPDLEDLVIAQMLRGGRDEGPKG
jgi:ABC-2 type transport system ATP-binding protein